MKVIWILLLSILCGAPARGATNLAPNGGFDVVEANLPAGWERRAGSSKELLYAADAPHAGSRFLKLDMRNVEKGVRVEWHCRQPIALEPGTSYRLEYYFRIDESNLRGGQAVYVRGWYLDAEKKRLNWRRVGSVALHTGGWARITNGWRFRQLEFTVPPSAAFLDMGVVPGRGFKGVVGVDSLRMVKVAKAQLSLPKGAFAFDFTAPGLKPAPGFTGAPADLAYSEAKGYGWRLRQGKAIRNTHNDNGYPNAMDGSGVGAGTFLCDLPNGRYLASTYTGGIWRTQIQSMNHVVRIGRKDLVKDVRPFNDLMDKEYFRWAHATLVDGDDLKRPGQAVWDKYLARRYRRHDFKFDVRNGQVALSLRGGLVNALLIFPAGRAKEYRETLEQVETTRRREFVETWAEFLPHPVEATAYRPDARDRSRGYVLFARHWMRRVEYASRPQPEEVNPTLRLLATPGEYEPVTFSLRPLRDVKNVRVRVGDLRSNAGDVLPGETFRVWFHQHRQERRPRPCTAYRINAVYLPDWDVRDLSQDITTRCWLSAKLPDDARPGLYTGAVRVTCDGGEAATVPIRLRVLSFKLIRKETLHTLRRAGNSVVMPYPSIYPLKPGDTRNKQFYRAAAIRDLHAHGYKPEYSVWWHGFWKIDGDRLTMQWNKPNSLSGPPDQSARMMRDLAPTPQKDLWVDACAVGLRHISPAFSGAPKGGVTVEHIGQWLDQLDRKFFSLGFERIYLAPWGEESHFPPGKGFEAFLKFHRHVRANRKRWPHIYTAHTCNTEWGQPPTIRDADLTCLGIFHGVSGSAEEQVEMAKQTGRPFGLYGIRGRWVSGFYFWRTGAYATYHEFYAPYWGTPNNDWDNYLGMDKNARQVMNEAPGWCNATYSPTGRMIGTWYWEEMREAVDDHDYVNTLEKLVEQASGKRSPAIRDAAARAKDVLSELEDIVEIDVDPSQKRGLVYRPLAEEDHDGLRWKVAEAAERLDAATQGRPFATPPPAAKPELFLQNMTPLRSAGGAGPAVVEAVKPVVLRVREVTAPIRVDGRLDEAPYRREPQVANFYDNLLRRSTRVRTTVHVLKHANTLYLGVTCFEPRMGRLRMKETEENGSIWKDDSVEVFLDPGHTQRSYYHFGVNAAGVRAAYWQPFSSLRRGVARRIEKSWQVAVQRGRDRWTVEFAFPLAEFDVSDPCFGVSVCRNGAAHGVQSCWVRLPGSSFHQPEAFADVYLPAARSALEKIWLGHLAAGENRMELWVGEKPGAAPVTVSMKSPDGAVRQLPVKKRGVEAGAVVYEAPYMLTKALGTYEFTVRAGDVPLGRYEGVYKAAFFTASLRKMFHRQGTGDPIVSDVEMLAPPGASLRGFSMRVRCLQDDKPLKEKAVSPLPGRAFRLRLGIADLAPGVYDVELSLLGPDGERLKRIVGEFQVQPPYDL